MTDPLEARCAALVREALEREPYPEGQDTIITIDEHGAVSYPVKDWQQRITATLGRMMAAAIDETHAAACDGAGINISRKEALRAAAQEGERQ